MKLGQEMRWMMNWLVCKGVAKPVVGSILVSGFRILTYKMDLTDNDIYQMVQLGDVSLFKNIKKLTLLPTIVSNLLQLKNVILKTVKKASKRLCDKAKGATLTNNHPVFWTRDNDFDLIKR
ncbi:hypothetical protein BD770DRAFT_438926 [Pilaira anomala]|nr:hypothetical protein BD770DRAFT_438926 [Pilaira anomala]